MANYKVEISYGDTVLIEDLTTTSAWTKTLLTDKKLINGNIKVEMYQPSIGKLYLYNEGDECTSVTGGWSNASFLYNYSYGTSCFTISKSDNMLAVNNTDTSPRGIAGYYSKCGYVSTNAIDLTNYNTLHVLVDYSKNSVRGAFGQGVCVLDDKSDGSNSTKVKSDSVPCVFYETDGETKTDFEDSIDISSITSSKYICVWGSVGDRSGSSAYIHVKKIWLE